MPSKTKTDPRATFASFSDTDLHDELEGLAVLARDRAEQIERMQPTCEVAEEQIARFQSASANRLAGLASRAMIAMSANPGTIGFKDAEQAAIHVVLASDDFANALRKHYAAKRPTDAALEPLRDQITKAERRRDAIRAELRLRELDSSREDDDRAREAALADLASAH